MKTIMIVDDSPTILMSIEAILGRAGYQVAKAGTRSEATGSGIQQSGRCAYGDSTESFRCVRSHSNPDFACVATLEGP